MRSYNFVYLFAGLIAMLALEPALEILRPGSSIVQLTFTLILVLGVWSLHPNRRWFRRGLALTAAAVLTSGGFAYSHDLGIRVANSLVIAVFCVATIRLTLQQVLRAEGSVSFNRVMGALCVYLLIGTVWSIFYGFAALLLPDAFSGSSPASHLADGGSAFLYYSFVTLTTLGYGDLTPLHPVARTLSYLEAVIGQLFLAVLVASLVGRYRAADGVRPAA